MEIVRQRKKRLLAWILTLVLCVGMWQGSVQAEGEDGGDGAITPTEVVNESNDPVAASETGDGVMPVADGCNLTYSDNLIDSNGVERKFKINSNETIGTYIVVTNDSTPIELTASSNGYNHVLLNWSMEGSGGGNGNTASIAPATGFTWSNCDKLVVTWGKIIVVKEGDSVIGVCYQKSIGDDAQPVTLTLLTDNICQGGMFFSGWNKEIEGGQVDGNTFTASFDAVKSYYSEVEVSPIYESNMVPESGNFTLNNNQDYELGQGKWKVNDGADGFTYEGNISFWVPTSTDGTTTSYSFSLVEQ